MSNDGYEFRTSVLDSPIATRATEFEIARGRTGAIENEGHLKRVTVHRNRRAPSLDVSLVVEGASDHGVVGFDDLAESGVLGSRKVTSSMELVDGGHDRKRQRWLSGARGE